MATASGTLNTSSSIVSGVSTREIYANGPTVTGISSVNGAGDRGSNSTGTLQNSANPSIVVGVTERIINLQSGINQGSSSTTTGAVEREVDLNTGVAQAGPSSTVSGTSVIIGRNAIVSLQAQSSRIIGNALKEFTATGLFNRPTENNLVAGIGARKSVDEVVPSFQPTTNNITTGLAEREIVLEQGIFSGESDSEQSTLNGVAVVKQTFFASGLTTRPTVNNLVSGVAEREIENNALVSNVALQPTLNNLLAGVAERTINGTGVVVDSDNLVSGVAEREIVSISADLADSDNLVTAQVLMSRVATGTLVDSDSKVVGFSENVVLGSGTLVPTTNNLVTGVAERVVEDNLATGALRPTTQNIVSGVAQAKRTASGIDMPDDVSEVVGLGERTVVATGALIHPDSKTRPPLNQAERIMVVSGINGFMLSGDVTVTVNANVGRLTSGAFKPTDEHLVSGVAEREITATGLQDPATNGLVDASGVRVSNRLSGIAQTDPSTVTGVSERVVTATGVLTTGPSVVTGLAERQVDLVSGVAQVDASVVSSIAERIITVDAGIAQVDASEVVGLSENIINGSGSIQVTDSSDVVGSGFRTVHTEPTSILGDTANSPDGSDSQIEYVAALGSRNPYYIRLSDVAVSDYEGLYQPTGNGQVASESGLDYIRVPSSSFNSYYKFRGSNVDLIVYNTTRSAWYVTTASVTEFLTNSFTVTNGSLNQIQITTSSETRAYGSEFDPIVAPDNLVDGLAERIIVDVDATPKAGVSTVDGFAERKSVANGLIVTDIIIQVVANIGRLATPDLTTGTSRVLGVAENIIVDDDASPATGPSTVAGVAERTIVLESGIEQVSDLSDVVGAGVRTSNLFDGIDMPDDPSDVAGVAERTVVLETGIEQTQDPVVAGVAERQIDLDAGIAQVGVSVVSGIAERTINGTGLLADSDNLVNGVSEREIRTSAALRTTTDNLVTGIAERTINLFQSPQAEPSQVNGLSERIINYFDGTAGQFPGPQSSSILGVAERVITLDSGLFSADSDVEQSHIIGLGERTINLVQGLIQDSDLEQSHVVGAAYWFPEWKGDGVLVTSPSLVVGVAEREIETNLIGQDLKPTDNNLVDGLAERIIVLDSGILMPDDVSEVNGLAERVVVLEQGIVQDSDLEQSHVVGSAYWFPEHKGDGVLVASPSLVVGLSERTIVQTGGGTLKPTDNNLVTAVAEREIEINEVTQELKPTDNNLVTGLAERIIVLEQGLIQDSDLEQSHVVALLDSVPILTIVRAPIADAVQAQSSEVDTVDADRVVRQIPDGLGPVRLSPAASDPNVAYSGNLTITLSGIGASHDHEYAIMPFGITVATSGFTDYVVTIDDNYNSYVKYHGPGEYHIIAFSTTSNEWVVFETDQNPLFFTGGETLTGSASGSREVATTSDSRNGPFKVIEQTSDASVTGVGEREIEINDITQDLQSGPSTIVGAGFRTAIEEETPVQAQPSTLQTPTGSFAERIIEVDVRGQVDTSVIPDPSTVDGLSERIITGGGGVQADASTTGAAERVIGWQRGDLVVPTRSRVVGVAEREIETNGVNQRITNEFNPSRITGVAERTIVDVDATPKVEDAPNITSVIKRTVHLLDGINSNDLDEQSGVITTAGDGDRFIVNAQSELCSPESTASGVAERKIDMSIFGLPIDNSIVPDPSTVTGVAERIVVLEKGVGIPSTTPIGDGPLLLASTDGEPTWNDWTINPYATPIPSGLPSIGSGTGAAVLENAASYTRWGASFGNQGYYIDSTNGDLVIDAKDVFMNLQPYNVQGDRNSGTFVEVHQLPWDDFFSGTYERVGRYGWAGRSLDFDNWTAANQRRWGSRDSWPTVADADPGDNGFSSNHMAMSVIDNPIGAWMYGREHDSGLWMYIYFVQDSNRPTRGQWAWIRDVDVSPDSISAGVELDHVYTGGFSTKGWNDADHDSYGYLTDSLLYQYSEDENLVQRHGLSGWYGIGRVATDELAFAELDGDTQNGRTTGGTSDHAFPEGILNSIDLEYSVIEGTSQDSSVYFYGQENGIDFRNDFVVDQYVNGNDAAPIPNIYGVPTGGDSNQEYAKIYHATDDADIDGVAERVITGGGALVATQPDPSSVQGIAEREIEINEITQELKPIENNIVVGIAERIITVDEGIHSADDYLDEQSRVTAIVYTNNIEQSRIHTKRKFVLRKERTKTFIVRQTPTG